MKNKLREYLRSFKYNRAAVIESGKLFFSLIGVGAVFAQLAVMALWQFGAGVVLAAATWFALYTQMEGVQ